MTGHRKPRDTRALARYDADLADDFRQSLGRDGPIGLAGVDEAGRGPLAGPVVAAAVVLPEGLYLPGLTDSKKLSTAQRDRFYKAIRDQALDVGVGVVSAETIDAINILNATRQAARQALATLNTPVDVIALDALALEDETRPQMALVRGDATSQSIAAASVVAKVVRDRIMTRCDAEFPEYGFAAHKGYGVATHMRILREIGPCSIHRMSFSGVCFFDQAWRPSRFFREMESELARQAAPPDPDQTAALIKRLEAQASWLPDREATALRQMIFEAARD